MKSIERHHFKITIATAVLVLIFIISMVFNSATWKAETEHQITDIDSRQTHLASKYVETNRRITDLEDENNEFKVQMAEIKTKLSNIESLLLEIRQDIKEHETR